MGDLSNLCELRGRAVEGKGCTRYAGNLKYCAKQCNRGHFRMCTTATDVDALVEPFISGAAVAALLIFGEAITIFGDTLTLGVS